MTKPLPANTCRSSPNTAIDDLLSTDGITVESLCAFVERSGENAVIIFRFDAPDTAIEVLRKSGLTGLSGEKRSGL